MKRSIVGLIHVLSYQWHSILNSWMLYQIVSNGWLEAFRYLVDAYGIEIREVYALAAIIWNHLPILKFIYQRAPKKVPAETSLADTYGHSEISTFLNTVAREQAQDSLDTVPIQASTFEICLTNPITQKKVTHSFPFQIKEETNDRKLRDHSTASQCVAYHRCKCFLEKYRGDVSQYKYIAYKYEWLTKDPLEPVHPAPILIESEDTMETYKTEFFIWRRGTREDCAPLNPLLDESPSSLIPLTNNVDSFLSFLSS
jgi:hypothetical protein